MTSYIQHKIGLDVGSTTAKIIVLNSENESVVFKKYLRHNTLINETVLKILKELESIIHDSIFQISVTGSAGYGLSEKLKIPFVQEVIATSAYVKQNFPTVKTLIDIGGEDSKMIFFEKNRSPDIRMNGSCAGGTGAFIDQIASLLNIETLELNELAKQYTHIYPIASRCGVFAKTDVQNLLARKIPLPDIAASTFHAVVVQTLNTLARGTNALPKILLLGGPLLFLNELKKMFVQNMNLKQEDVVDTDYALYTPAYGSALSTEEDAPCFTIHRLKKVIEDSAKTVNFQNRLNPLFKDESELKSWQARKVKMRIKQKSLKDYNGIRCFLGIDSGSTTTKIVVIGENRELLFKYYANNKGNPIVAVDNGLRKFSNLLKRERPDKPLQIAYSTSTGYGEDLIKAAFSLQKGVVETIAHYTAAHFLEPKVSFIMDIGGQDMKAIFIEDGVINRIDLNESCSSGCGSFIQTFGNTLGFEVGDFANMAVQAQNPTDLGTRCTVFMNSKVKQSLRENASVEDISAGLAISVIKNALYKVLKLRDVKELGEHIVVQGGTFKNPSVHRALEVLSKRKVLCTDIPELMGAYGAALISLNTVLDHEATLQNACYSEEVKVGEFDSKHLACKGCVNNCTITRFQFQNNQTYYSGNKCEKIFSNSGEKQKEGFNFFEFKYKLLFNRKALHTNFQKAGLPKIGIPRVLNMYENFPFWHTLLSSLGFEVVLSKESNNRLYESGQGSIMSDNVCFPAKLVHGHIVSLAKQKVDRILYPMEFFQKNEFEHSDNSYMCPVASGYPDVIKNSLDPASQFGIPQDQPIINYSDEQLLQKSIIQYLKPFGISKSSIQKAFRFALAEQEIFRLQVQKKGQEIIDKNKQSNHLTVVLAGRPYHVDPLINHKIPEILTHLGIDIITEDAIPLPQKTKINDLHVLTQWMYSNRIYSAAQWVAEQGNEFQFVQFNSFGCGPDAIVIDEVVSILKSAHKIHTSIRIDDINSTGSVKLRLRSMIESLKIRRHSTQKQIARTTTPIFTEKDKHRVILAPHFADFYSPFFPAMAEVSGYKIITLPHSTQESTNLGLKYANNEICYPATLIVGDILQALKSGKYKPEDVVVGITQTGGQCRASSYLSLIKKGMISAGFGDIPVITFGLHGKTINPQPGFTIDWKKLLPITLSAALFADALSSMFYSTVSREKEKGTTQKLVDLYYDMAYEVFVENQPKDMYRLLEKAVEDFNKIEVHTKEYMRIGLVGEEYIKYSAFGNNNIVQWLIDHEIEVVMPPLINFFIQNFVNFKTNKKTNIRKASLKDSILWTFEKYANRNIDKADKILKNYRYYRPHHSIHSLGEKAKQIVSLNNQFGEGWLIPAEISAFAEEGITEIVSLQPFGCIANHVVSKGVEKRIKELYPEMSLLFLDFDNDISEVNILNRLHFMIQGATSKESKS